MSRGPLEMILGTRRPSVKLSASVSGAVSPLSSYPTEEGDPPPEPVLSPQIIAFLRGSLDPPRWMKSARARHITRRRTPSGQRASLAIFSR